MESIVNRYEEHYKEYKALHQKYENAQEKKNRPAIKGKMRSLEMIARIQRLRAKEKRHRGNIPRKAHSLSLKEWDINTI